MQAWTTTAQQVKELAHRAGDGIEVSLLWHETGGGLTVTCTDERTGDWFTLDADPENALDVFHHPFAYAAHRGVEYSVPARAYSSAEALAA
jgi:hypothetical protein